MSNAKRIRAAIAQLERRPDIAAFLLQFGIKGTKKHPEHCPIYHYLSARRGVVVRSVGCCQISYPNPDPYDTNQTKLYIDTPERIAQFIEDFDDGKHPGLEDPAALAEAPEAPSQGVGRHERPASSCA